MDAFKTLLPSHFTKSECVHRNTYTFINLQILLYQNAYAFITICMLLMRMHMLFSECIYKYAYSFSQNAYTFSQI